MFLKKYTGDDPKQRERKFKRIKQRKLEKDQGRRLGGIASLGPFGARLLERKLEKDRGDWEATGSH